MAVEFYIHKMSEHMETGEIINWLVTEGGHVEEHQPIIEVMTDKFVVELEAPAAGILAGIRPGCVPGATVPVGETIAYIVQPGEDVPRLAPLPGYEPPPVPEPAPVPAVAATSAVEPELIGRVKSTPVARRMAKDLGIDIEAVRGTGPGGRVMEADIRAFVTARTAATAPVEQPAAPAPPPQTKTEAVAPTPAPAPVAAAGAADGAFRWQELTPVQRITGERMRESVVNAPQFALEVTADATNLLWLREALQDRVTLEARARLSVTGLLVKIVAAALTRHPLANAQFDGGRLRLHHDINIGVAFGTDQGLVVPVIKHADRKTLAEVTAEMAAFQEKARTMHFRPEDLSDGTFTVSNLGMFGVERFAAIVNPPQSAILSVGAVVKTPVALSNDTVGVRPLMALTVTIDHRVLDGLQGARFLGEVKQKIETPYFLI
ncbi:MAG: 2-oxo acid dehydrogenase subunit E2 [Caldilineaceae bacterium]|nr:2-oxo acid dehydrogenase subunit E2 [Caldilineaceae bacterium]